MMTDPQPSALDPERSSARIHVPGGWFGKVLLGLALLWVVNSVAVGLTSEPLQQVTRMAKELRPGEELFLLGGGFHSGLLGMTAEGRFRVDRADGPHELELVITRPTPFLPWRIVRMTDQRLDR